MKYENFEDLPVWQDGIDLTVAVFTVTEDKAFRFKGDIANQVQRASLSIPNNVAEGFERGTTQELITFLYYAKGSAGEVRSICHVVDRLPHFAHLKSKVSEIRDLARSISKQLSAWAQSLQETDIKGARYLTEQSREAYHRKGRADGFLKQLQDEHVERVRRLTEGRKQSGD